jgi:two-component sensor histidine kinase
MVEVDWNAVERGPLECIELSWEERDGPTVAEPIHSQGTGNAIIERLLRYGGGTIERRWDPTGLCVKVQFPIAGHDG